MNQRQGAGDVIVTPRLRITRQTLDDATALHAIMSDWDVVRMTGSWPYPVTLDFVRDRIVTRDGEDGFYGIIRDGDTPIGTGQVAGDEIGYLLSLSHWGRGLGSEVARALVSYGFEASDCAELSARVWADNPASSRILTKLGFREVERSLDENRARQTRLVTIHYSLPRP
ncbi:MAG: GNAT family N-acetyltransferase [Pseudomonadota bacterium]|nr:GNAT family N-acetyltransferase [Pseudomonadota bacterium]